MNAFDIFATLFEIEPVIDEQFPFIIHHPIFRSPYLLDSEGTFNLLEDKERFKKYKAKILEYKKERWNGNYHYLISNVDKAYRLFFIDTLRKFEVIDYKQAGELILDEWASLENINGDINIAKEDILECLQAADKRNLSDLPETMIIYRGTHNPEHYDGFSWTLSEEKARWFANRFNRESYLFKAQVKKQDVFAYITSRNEEEIVVDYTKLIEPKKIE